ncbi:MAG: hypothetical protein IJX49_03095, partial [Clostridia bacterium]|nr:hypothetical protein [Clostridia bacterium]
NQTPDGSVNTPPTDEYPDSYYQAEAIMNEAELLGVGEALNGTYELSGTVTQIDIEYTSSRGVCLYFDVYEPQSRELYCYQLKGDGASTIKKGDFITVSGRIKNYKGMLEFDKGCTLVSYKTDEDNVPPALENDPYANTSASVFYANYSPATSNEDAYYRSLHGFMSGELETPDQAPTLSAYQPMNGTKYIRNSSTLYAEDGNAYIVVDAYGKEAFRVYRDGAYITLEEVAAFVYAFGTYPANYTVSKNTDPNESIWGIYLRLNHTSFSGDTSRYPYEPVLPNISGCGGDLNYYEMDIGTTGTDCDPSYPTEIYNDGNSITRGAARIVYGKTDLNKNGVYEIGELHVFYTYNHYNDFQEYLNYAGGWGEMFGNITGGGTISSTSDYNPTEYVNVSYEPITSTESIDTLTCEYVYRDERKYLLAIPYAKYLIA